MSAADLDLSPPEVPEPTFFESLLRYGLLLGAVFQLVCILSLIMPFNKSHEQEVSAERSEVKVGDQTKKTKGPVPQTRQKPKKETKKKR